MSQRSKTPSDLAGRCPSCWLLLGHCICPRIPRLQSRVRFLVLRHAKERWRSTNTARIAALALPQIRIVDYGLRDQPGLELELERIPEGAFLLFPGSTPSADFDPPAPPDAPIHVVLPDGNWHQAGRLARRLATRPGLRRLALPDVRRAPHTLRRTNISHHLSTIEAMAACVERFGETETALGLRQVYELMVRASVAGRGGRNTELLGTPEAAKSRGSGGLG